MNNYISQGSSSFLIKDKKLKITKEEYLAFNDNQKNNYLSLIMLLFNLEH